MIYIIKMPTKLVPGTSLFVTIFVSVIVTFLHSINYGSIDLMLVLMLVVGSIVGVQVGQKLGEQIDSSGLKALLAILLLVVGIVIAYDTTLPAAVRCPAAATARPCRTASSPLPPTGAWCCQRDGTASTSQTTTLS